MKTLMIVMVLAVVAHAESDAEKIVRLEKENAELRQEVGRVRAAMALLQKRIHELTSPATSKTPDKGAAPAAGKFIDPDKIGAMVPKELWGNENIAAGEPFNPVDWNTWLKDNLIGKQVEFPPVTFWGLTKDDDGRYWIRIGTARAGANCFLDASYQPVLAKLKEQHDYVVVSGKIKSIQVLSSEFNRPRVISNPQHMMVLEECTIKAVPKPKTK